MYKDEQEMLNGNGNGEPMPTHPGMPLLEGVYGEGQVGHVEEPSGAIVVEDVVSDELRIFVHAPQYEWCLEVHVQGHDKGAHQRIVVIEELLHRFGCKTEASELELHQKLDQVQTRYSGLAKELHDLKQRTMWQLASCCAHLESLESQMWQNTVSMQQASTRVEALLALVAQLETEWWKADFQQLRNKLDAKAEKNRENQG